MITLNALTFWGICALAAMGLVRAFFDVFFNKDDKPKKHWAKSSQMDAPEGFRWALVRKDDDDIKS